MSDRKTVDVEAMIRQLPALSSNDLVRLSTAIKGLLSVSSIGEQIPAPHMQSSDDWIVIPLVKAVPTIMSATQVRNTRNYPAFVRDKMPALKEYLDNVVLDHQARYAFMRLAWRLLAEALRAQGLVPGASMMLAHAQRIPEAVDRAFPGYYASGMLGMVLAKRLNEG